MFRLLFELNRRMPNGTYGGVRGIINLYSILSLRQHSPFCFDKMKQRRRKDEDDPRFVVGVFRRHPAIGALGGADPCAQQPAAGDRKSVV